MISIAIKKVDAHYHERFPLGVSTSYSGYKNARTFYKSIDNALPACLATSNGEGKFVFSIQHASAHPVASTLSSVIRVQSTLSPSLPPENQHV